MEQVAYAAGGALVAGVAGALALTAVRRRPVWVQAAVVSLVSVVATALGVVVAARKMFISEHDLDSLLVILGAAGTVGLGAALVLGGRVGRASRSLEGMARAIGEGRPVTRDRRAPATDELARLARRLEHMAVQLDEARASEHALERSRRDLVAWVSHDLRTPLAGLRAMVEALEDGVVDDPETVTRYHATMRLEVDRLSGLVDDLFELSRIQAGALELSLERASLGDLVSDALAAASVAAEAKGVRLEGRLVGSPEAALSTPEMARVVHNLLDNAIRHTPADGTIVVEAGVAEDHAYVSVLDTCGGIETAQLDRVFDLAYRGDGARSRAGGGAGLGLAIARGLVEAHRGDIAVRNENGGCRFTVSLPLGQAS